MMAAAIALASTSPAVAQRVWSEDFEGLPLGPNVDEASPGANVWTEIPPAGWTVDDTKMPAYNDPAQDGRTEWSGWSFAKKSWWITVDDQRRSEFAFGQGTVMIADPDEWDDLAHAKGFWDGTVKTGAIDISGQPANSLVFVYDSSWRPEARDDGAPNWPVGDDGSSINNQTGYITATFGTSPEVEIQRWTSVSDEETYHDHMVNESVVIPLNNPAGATSLVLKVGMEKAANDWWWAVDNFAVGAPPFASGIAANGVSFTVRIVEALGRTVDTSKPITATLDGTGATPLEISQDETGTYRLVAYTQAPKVFQPGTRHTVVLSYTSDQNKAIQDTLSFVAPSYTTVSARPQQVTATLTDAEWLTIDDTKPITLALNGTPLTAGTAVRTDTRVAISAIPPQVLTPGARYTLTATFTTGAGETVVDPVDFIAPSFVTLPASLATAAGTGTEAGLRWRTHQQEAARANTVALAEQQLAGQLGVDIHDTNGQEADGTFSITTVNFEQGGGNAGFFNGAAATPLDVADEFIPGIPGTLGGNDNIVGEALAYVEIPTAGLYTMVVVSDDGMQLSAGISGNATQTILASFGGGGTREIYVKVDQAGVYLFRLLWLEGTGGAHIEWSTLNADGSRALVGGTQTGALKAYRRRSVSEPALPVTNRIWAEDFEGLVLGPNVDEVSPGAAVWTQTPPPGWVIDDTKMPAYTDPARDGMTEWSGWSFAKKNWWITVDDQQRSQFVYGQGTVMIADPDEWDDAAHAVGFWDGTAKSGAINIAGKAANSLVLVYDSSWRPEATDDGAPNWPVGEDGSSINNQTGYITAAFDGSPASEVQRWTSIGEEETYHDHRPNEAVVVALNNPAGAQSLSLLYGMEKAANDWWWAVDNLAVGTPPFASAISSDGVSFTVRIVEALNRSVDTTKPVTATVDGAPAGAVELSQEEAYRFVKASQAPKVYQPGTRHTVTVRYNSDQGTLLEDTLSFVAPSYTAVTARPQQVTATLTDTAAVTIDDSKPITLALNGTPLAAGAAVRTDTRVVLSAIPPQAFAPGSKHTLTVTFTTGAGETVVDPVEFVAPNYPTLAASLAAPAGSGTTAGMRWRTHQQEAGRGNSVPLAEQQLAGQLGADIHDTNGQEADGTFSITSVNFEQSAGNAGFFSGAAAVPLDVPDDLIPGIPGTLGGTDNIVGEALAYVEFPAPGIYTMVVVSDDGMQLSVGTAANATQTVLASFGGGGTRELHFKVDQAGVYYFRLLWLEGTGGAHVEWSTLSNDGSRALVNGAQTGALKAYRGISVASQPSLSIASSGANVTITASGTGPFQLQKKSSLSDATWTNVGAPGNGPFTVPADGGAGFYRVQR